MGDYCPTPVPEKLPCLQDIRADCFHFGPLVPEDCSEAWIYWREADDRRPEAFKWDTGWDVYALQRERMRSRVLATKEDAMREGFCNEEWLKPAWQEFESQTEDSKPGRVYVELSHTLGLSIRFRRMAKTEGGRLALVFRGTKAGDEVVILHGCCVPMILRRSGGNRYQVLGEALVKGMMCGEMATWAEDEADEIILV